MEKGFNIWGLVLIMLSVSCAADRDEGYIKPTSNKAYKKLIAQVDSQRTAFKLYESDFFKNYRQLEIGDTLNVFEMDTGIIYQLTGKVSVKAQVKDFLFSKPDGKQAILDCPALSNAAGNSLTFTLWLYYWDEARGYAPGILKVWDRILKPEDYRGHSNPTSGIKGHSEVLQNDIGFLHVLHLPE